MLRRFAVGTLALLSASCGQSSSHHDNVIATGGTGAGGGTSGGAGAGARAGAGGESGANSFACGTTTPFAGASSGFERCARGYVRRTMPGTCASGLPRVGPVENYDSSVDGCEYDTDCTESADGPYAHCGPRAGGVARTCVEGCVDDEGCGAGELCLCGEPVGRCVPASCTKGTDCATGFDCAAFDSAPGCFSTEFACQTPNDTCASAGDCDGFSPNPSFCSLRSGVRVCSINQCTTP
ncbi:MAG TPA: hypothetical protein VFZ53_33525 [Polyangiaceae bacterium]